MLSLFRAFVFLSLLVSFLLSGPSAALQAQGWLERCPNEIRNDMLDRHLAYLCKLSGSRSSIRYHPRYKIPVSWLALADPHVGFDPLRGSCAHIKFMIEFGQDTRESQSASRRADNEA